MSIAALQSENFSDPASVSSITFAENSLGCRFSAGYRSFLLISDGYDGFVGQTEHALSLWPTSEVADSGYEQAEEAGVILIGSNGGPTAFGFSRLNPSEFISIPFGTADREEIRVLGRSFSAFIQAVADGEGW